ncbi:MAG: hypothetical protein RL522_1111, partial [Pseudomonadota bacterium]
MVECAGLEIRYTGLPYRGFESLLLRQNKTFQLSQSCCQALRAPHLARLFACALADSLANDRDSLSLLRATFH